MMETGTLAAFRMRCWYELGDKAHQHFVEDYAQLQRDACGMREQIIQELKREYPERKGLPEGKADAVAELLVTALLADHYGGGFSDTAADFVSRAYGIVPQIANSTLLCYLLVLLFWLDEPTEELKERIDGLMASWREEELTPEDRYVKGLYDATANVKEYMRG